jgi:structural maintenance of chromosome 4
MDEIDAALDYRNVAIVASYVKRQACSAQFIVISLRQNMFEMSDKMVGIYKIKDVTKTVSIAPRKFEKKLNEEMNNSRLEMQMD